MAEQIAGNGEDSFTKAKGFHVEIPLRGCNVSLADIKTAYIDFQDIVTHEGERLLSKFTPIDEQTPGDFEKYVANARKGAFLVTVTVIGGEDNIELYGENASIFDRSDLPLPIKIIFFTNETAFRRFANDRLPPNRFSLWLHFNRPPILDPNPLVSNPTPNSSVVSINADMSMFLRAAQTITHNLAAKKSWYAPLHEKFAYDFGFWLLAFPYALFMVTTKANQWLPIGTSLETFRIPFFIYALGVSLLGYRAFMSYLKWALPVNVLRENRDTAWKHRGVFAVVLLSLIGSFIWALLGKQMGLGG